MTAAQPSHPWFTRYAWIVIISGAAVAAATALIVPTIDLDDWHLWVFAGLVLLGELVPIDVPRREGLDRITTSTAFGFAILLLYGPEPAMIAYAAASVIADIAARLSLLKILFNAAQYVIAVGIAALAMAAVGAQPPLAQLDGNLLAVAAGAAAFLIANHVLAGIAAALLMRAPIGRYLVSDLAFQVVTAGFVLGLAPVVAACAEISLELVPLCLLPVLAIYFSARTAARYAHRAVHDVLTGLPNRLLLHERLERELRAGCPPTALMIVDLDDFKAVNDTLGHAQGDRLLTRVGARLRGALSATDMLARLGGDEFAVLLAGPVDSDQGAAVARRLVAALDEPFELDGVLLQVRASVGVACFPEHGAEPDGLLRRADVALYCAKAAQHPVELYAPSRDHHSVDRLMLAGQLRRGLGRGEIMLEYQPKFPLDGSPPRGVEALARWRHPDLGRIGPDGFVPLAEQAGLIALLTDVVLDEAIAQCARWQRDGLDLRVSVNLSPRSLTDRELPRRIDQLLTTHGVAPELLQLEVTESRAVPAGRGTTTVADELRAMGVSIAIDDFGTGFSSLVQLQRLPVDEIKIDRSFVAMMGHSESDTAIVRSTIDLARNLGLHVTAEGVETEAARAQLAAMGCELAQGYGLCPPISAARCARVIREHELLAPRDAPGGEVLA
jgi:diguanylate cyclase (GGDEF)-like protein